MTENNIIKIKLPDITWSEYWDLANKNKATKFNYAAIFSPYLNTPLDLFKIGEFNKLTFGEVKDLQHTFQNGVGLIEMINFVNVFKNIEIKHIAKNKFFDICRARRYFEEQIYKIYKLEKNLSYDVTAQDESAGINSLDKFGVLIQIDSLAGGDPLKYEPVKKLPYDICFAKMLMEKTKDQVRINKERLNKR